MLQAPQEDRSISERHELLILKHDLHWQWFNILTFGVVEGGASITEAIAKVDWAMYKESRQDKGKRLDPSTKLWRATSRLYRSRSLRVNSKYSL